jgi:lipid II:glycine glycyltransferase (peptidoglycan interpeptide bridge formation enzyme)
MNQTDRTIRTATEQDQSTWNSHIVHPLQSWEWGEFRQSMGIDVARIIDGERRWQLTFHAIPHTSWCVGYFPKGPQPTQQMVEQLKKLGKEKHAIFIQLEPDVRTASHVHLPQELRPSHRSLFTKYTFELDLTHSEEDLLKQFHSKTRYNIRVAQKHDVKISEDNSQEAFAAYLKLSQETTSRQGFYAHSEHYHRTMWNILYKAGIAHLFTATYKGEVVAAWILFLWNKQLYYPYGASSRNHREIMAPTLLLWEIIRWAKAKGVDTFDLWGALGPNPDPNDPWFGFHRFKQGFNPTLVEFIGSFDLVVHPLLYTLYCLADSLRWTLLKIKAHR